MTEEQRQEFIKDLKALCTMHGVHEIVGLMDMHGSKTGAFQVSNTNNGNEFYNSFYQGLCIEVTNIIRKSNAADRNKILHLPGSAESES